MLKTFSKTTITKKSKQIFLLAKKHWKLVLIILLILGGGGKIISQQQAKNKPQLTFIKPVRENIIKTLEVSGQIDAKQKAVLRFIAGGKITYLGVNEGDWVNKWQTIAVIDQRDLQKRLQQDLNNYMKERWDWEQLSDDTKDRWLPKDEQREKDKSHWDLENEVFDVEIRDIAISNTIMSAPFSGILIKSPVQTTGVNLLSADYFELIDPSSLYFSAQIDEEDIAQIKLGQTGRLILDAYPSQEIITQISYIAYQAKQTTSGTIFEIDFPINLSAAQTIPIPNKQTSATNQQTDTRLYQQLINQYRLGMNGDIKIELAYKENVLTIPLLSTKERDDKFYVDIKINEATTEEREIKVGLETDEKVEIISGLTENDEILLP